MEATSYMGLEHRRSHRVPFSMRLFILSLDPAVVFAGHCETTKVSSHGCEIHAPRTFKHGTWLCLGNLPGNHVATARVVHSVATDSADLAPKVYSFETDAVPKMYRIGLELDAPGNVWGVEGPPSDWKHVK